MLLLMIVFLMAQLHSFSRLFLVMSVVPMGLIGIVVALLIFGQPLGFVAILGILALFGMIARNAVILIEQIETERAQGPQIWDAVVESDALPLPSDHADGDFHGSRIYSDRPDCVLGADGFRDHGRLVRGDDTHSDRSARALRHMVPRQGACARRRCGLRVVFIRRLRRCTPSGRPTSFPKSCCPTLAVHRRRRGTRDIAPRRLLPQNAAHPGRQHVAAAAIADAGPAQSPMCVHRSTSSRRRSRS